MATGSFIHRFQSGGTAIQQFASPREIIQTGDPVHFVVSQVRLTYRVASPLNLEIFILDLEGLAFLLTRQLAITSSIVSLEIFADRLRLAADQRIRAGLGRALAEGEFLDVLIGYEYQPLLGPTVDWERIENRPPYEELLGPPGYAAEVRVGTVTTGLPGSSASVTNSGTTNSAILDFAIPRGNTGSSATVTNQAVTAALGYSPANLAGANFSGNISAPSLNLNSTSAATSTTTGALILPGVGIGNGEIFSNKISLGGCSSILGSSDANFALLWSDIYNSANKDNFFRWGYFSNNAAAKKQTLYEFNCGRGTSQNILQMISNNSNNEISVNCWASRFWLGMLPTSANGLTSGQLWRDETTKTIKYV
ncbi:MAG: hypothetical protein ACRC8A_12615 [Microcoleaceae cyanobacterium]